MTQTKSLLEHLRSHPFITTLAALATAGIIYKGCTSEKFSTVAQGEVVDKKYIKDEKNSYYVLDLHIHEPKNTPYAKEINTEEYLRNCRLYVTGDDKMPLAVLDDTISAGSTVFIPYWEQGFPLGAAETIYKEGCMGQVASSNVRVVLPGESAEQARTNLENKLEQAREEGIRRAKWESLQYHSMRMMF